MMRSLKPCLQIDGPLFDAVQNQGIFEDCKTFVDCTPKVSLEKLLILYEEQKNHTHFDLVNFIHQYFHIPKYIQNEIPLLTTMEAHIENLWLLLKRDADGAHTESTLIPLPHPYLVPGGRFREIYYWDSYFISEGLIDTAHENMISAMAKNMSYLIDTVGFVPNGNRLYYLSRSQPPVFVCLLDLMERKMGSDAIKPYIQSLEKEYQFWMNGHELLTSKNPAYRRVVRLPDGTLLNRYWDDVSLPRPESYREDREWHEACAPEHRPMIYHNIRAACESGWDFSSRWFRDVTDATSIRTTEILPIDLNALMFFIEFKLSHYFSLQGDLEKSDFYRQAAERRRKAMDQYLWNAEKRFYFDYCWTEHKPTNIYSLAALFPLFLKISSEQQAIHCVHWIEKEFLKEGGLVTTLTESNHQWDNPNGWAPLHWIAVNGLKNYKFHELAHTIARTWLDHNRRVFHRYGKMVEKYNVCDLDKEAGGGEYSLQDGFGWTNAIAVALQKMDGLMS